MNIINDVSNTQTISNITNTPLSVTNTLHIDHLQSGMLNASHVQSPAYNGSTATIANLYADTVDVSHDTVIGNLVANELNASTTAIGTLNITEIQYDTIFAQDVNIPTFSAATLTVPTIKLQAFSGTGVASNVIGSTGIAAASCQATGIQADTITSKGMTGGTVTTQNFTYNDTSQTEYYSSPSEGVFRGICFFSDIDVGLGSNPTNISLSMGPTSSNHAVYMQGFNTYLNHIDNDQTLGGAKAYFSLCAPTTPARTLRYQDGGDLAIYSDGTKIWQNGSMVSDIKLKQNITVIPSAMEKILKIDGVTFDYKIPPYEKTCGVMLEQVQEVFPECVVSGELVHLEKLLPLIVEGIKELDARNQEISRLINGSTISSSFPASNDLL